MSTVSIVLIVALLITLRFVLRWSILYPETLWDWSKEDVNSIYTADWPEDFLWGSATAAFQVEGHNKPSNWTMWENSTDDQGNPRIHKGQKAGDACDHFHRFRDDMNMAAEDLGINSYRFSIAWSRIEPTQGEYDQEAIQHYSDVIDACLENGIKPMVTLHHFSHPLWFEELGSFEKEENIEHFLRFAETMFTAYSDRVEYWCTHNECGPFATMGWGLGVFPPGKNSLEKVGTVLLNLVKSHTRVYKKLKSLPNGDKVQIGLVKNIFQFDPWSRWNPIHWVICRFIDEVYNESLIRAIRDGVFEIKWRPFINMRVDVSESEGATDFIGLNYYSNLLINIRRGIDASSGPPFKGWGRKGQVMTDFPYTTYPEGFYRAIQRISSLEKPIIVTENGIPDNLDDRRQDWIERYLYAMKKAMSEGIDVRGYQYWSLLDNFEWAEGYDMRFGLYAVDFETQERTLRDGAKAYAKIVKGDTSKTINKILRSKMYTPINSFKSKNSNIQALVDLHIAVGQNIWSDQDFVIKETSKYYGVFPETKKNEKVGTIHKNGTEFEFPRVALNKTDRHILESDGLIIKNTYSKKSIPQVKISGLTTQKIRTHNAILKRCIEASMRRHSKF